MKLLLDTHIWLWGLLEPERLSTSVRVALESPANELWLSPISVWEATVLAERGRIAVNAVAADWVREMLRAIPLRESPITYEIAVASREMPLSHQDPADRFIAATAHVLGLTLVTADERLLMCNEYERMANR